MSLGRMASLMAAPPDQIALTESCKRVTFLAENSDTSPVSGGNLHAGQSLLPDRLVNPLWGHTEQFDHVTRPQERHESLLIQDAASVVTLGFHDVAPAQRPIDQTWFKGFSGAHPCVLRRDGRYSVDGVTLLSLGRRGMPDSPEDNS
jgi:hypothetical protein